MADLWYYGKTGSKVGPFTGRELREMAGCGLLPPEDTVWRQGIPRGVPARKVKGLFSPGTENAAGAGDRRGGA